MIDTRQSPGLSPRWCSTSASISAPMLGSSYYAVRLRQPFQFILPTATVRQSLRFRQPMGFTSIVVCFLLVYLVEGRKKLA